MSLTNPTLKADSVAFSGKNISSAASVYQYTAGTNERDVILVRITNAAGNGDYVAYLKRTRGGVVTIALPKATLTAASGETGIEFQTIEIYCKSGDIIDIMVDGLAGDTSVSGTVDIVALNFSLLETSDNIGINWADIDNPTTTVNLSGTSTKALQPTVAGRTLDVTATGAAGIDWGNLENPTTTNALTNTSISATGVTATVAISATQAASVAAGNLAITAYATWSQAITSTSTLALPGTKLWLAVKNSTADADNASIIFIERTAGLTVLNGAAYTGSATDGTITVSGSSGAWVITGGLQEAATALLTGLDNSFVYELKTLVSGDTYILSTGYCDISTGVVRAIA